MRALVVLLVVACFAAVVLSFVFARELGAWLPPAASGSASDVDGLFRAILWIVAAVLALTFAWLALAIARGTRRTSERAAFTSGDLRVEIAWTMVPALVLTVLAIVQSRVWDRMRASSFAPRAPTAEVWAAQFAWRFHYAGPDGRLGTRDDFERPFELVVPAGETVRVVLRSRDVIHSFFVPDFRLKQDVLPGTAIPADFVALEPGVHDLVCAELCGWGHYQMAGRVRVVTRAEFDAWLARESAAQWTNGREDRP